MMMKRSTRLAMTTIGLLTAQIATTQIVAAQTPAFDPRSWKRDVAGPKTQVLVLGSPHLSNLKGLQPAWMTTVIDKLAAYKPTVVTIEALSGEQCALLSRYTMIYLGMAEQYCPSTEAAQKATGLDQATAVAQMYVTLATWPAEPRPGARRRLASIMLAPGEPASALVQWLRLPETERREGDGLDEALVKRLRQVDGMANENYQVGARLAARCGLERVYAIDDHTADAVHSEDPGFGVAIKRIWSGPNKAVATAQAQPFANAADMLATYRLSNSVSFQRDSIEGDFGASIKDKTPEYWGRRYVGWWEVRNLRMVANIRAAFAAQPGPRDLSIVGSSHKAYFDAYLDMMHEVQLVDAEAILR